MVRSLIAFCHDERGNVAVPAAIMLASIVALAGGALDLMSVSNQKSALQELADNASLAAVKELAVSADDAERTRAVAKAYVQSSGAAINKSAVDVNLEDREVTVTLTAKPRASFELMRSSDSVVTVSATARLSGRGGNICMIGLSPNAITTLSVRSRADITAETCAIYSNSTSTFSMVVAGTASVTAELICVAGGFRGKRDESRYATVEDCTPIEDPLAMRVAPDFERCDFVGTMVTDSQALSPGVYCGGLVVDGGTATLAPGEYIIADGPLMVTDHGTLRGDHVGFFLAGKKAKIQFDYEANIDVSAPKDGVMAGLLLYSSPYEHKLLESGLLPEQIVELQRLTDGIEWPDHTIRSDNARRLVGTIYLPNGKLLIDGRNPIADRSEYTVIIADTFELRDGPNLVLRTDYHLSDVPVPDGVGPVSQANIRLVH